MEERANLFGFTIPTSLFHEQTTGTSVSLDNTAVRLPLASDRSAWGHAATAVTEGCPPICCLTRVIYTHVLCCYALADDSNEMNLLGLKIPDALFHAETTEGEANVVGLKMPDFLFHETPTEASDKEPSLFGWTLPKAVQSAVLGDPPPAAAPAAPGAAAGAAAAAAAGGAAPVPEV